MSDFVDISNLGKTYSASDGPVVVVEGFDLKIARGECVCLLGHSGCGKSSVLTMIAGLNAITCGNVIIDGQAISGPGADRSIVFQSPCLLPWMSVQENVKWFLKQHHLNRSPEPIKSQTMDDQIIEYLQIVGLLDQKDQHVSQLSDEEQHRLSIARAMASVPKILLLDDPFALLSGASRIALQTLVGRIQQHLQLTTLMISNDVDEALLLSDRVVLMTNSPQATIGQIVSIDVPRPRDADQLLGDARYQQLRQQVANFLEEERQKLAA